MISMHVMDKPSKWEYHIHLVYFYYNNGYLVILKMSHFEALYDKKCNTPVNSDNPTDKGINGTNLLKEMEVQMKIFRNNLKVS
jgi:hypothetical protein